MKYYHKPLSLLICRVVPFILLWIVSVHEYIMVFYKHSKYQASPTETTFLGWVKRFYFDILWWYIWFEEITTYTKLTYTIFVDHFFLFRSQCYALIWLMSFIDWRISFYAGESVTEIKKKCVGYVKEMTNKNKSRKWGKLLKKLTFFLY